MTTYTSTAHRRGGYWFIQCNQVPAAMSTAARLDQAVKHQREAIAFVTEIPESQIDVTVTPVLPESIRDELAEARHLREQADAAEREAAERWRHAAQALRDEGLSVRDVGQVLGVSYQRAHQLVS